MMNAWCKNSRIHLHYSIALLYCTSVCASWPSLGLRSECLEDVPQQCDEEYAAAHRDLLLPEGSSLRAFLFTRDTAAAPDMLHLCRGTLPRNSTFHPDRGTVLIVPGYLFGLCEMEIYKRIQEELLKQSDLNVILMDTKNEFGLNYLTAVYYLDDVAKQIAQILRNLKNQRGLESKRLHIVAQSLGAHTAGIVANYFPVHRITGLDPAGPLFPLGTSKHRMLDPGDAEVVDVIHCDAGFFGIEYPIGHADFYVNGGSKQTNCSLHHTDIREKSNLWLALSTSLWPSACYHYECLEFFLDSLVAPTNWIAKSCTNYKAYENGACEDATAVMGYHFRKEIPNSKPLRKYYLDFVQ